MHRYNSESSTRIRLLVPSYFVQQPSVDLPPPVPGSPQLDIGDGLPLFSKDEDKNPFRFIVPWPSAAPTHNNENFKAKTAADIQDWGCNPHQPIPCEIDQKRLANYLSRYDVAGTVRNILQKSAGTGNSSSSSADDVANVMHSLQNPFTSAKRPDDPSADIVWTVNQKVRVDPTLVLGDDSGSSNSAMGPKKSNTRHHRITTSSDGWSIITFISCEPEHPDGSARSTTKFCDAPAKLQRAAVDRLVRCEDVALASKSQQQSVPVVRKNIIYNADGVAIAQVDFGHGNSVGTHVHSLAEHNLEHVASNFEDHLFHLPAVPWAWMCIPIDDRRLFDEAVVQSYFSQFPAAGRCSSDILVPTVLQKRIAKISSKLGANADVQKLLQGFPAEANPFLGHLPADRYLAYRTPKTIDWDIYEQPSWRWLCVDLAFEDYSASAMGMSPAGSFE